jgi:hypothetical protein
MFVAAAGASMLFGAAAPNALADDGTDTETKPNLSESIRNTVKKIVANSAPTATSSRSSLAATAGGRVINRGTEGAGNVNSGRNDVTATTASSPTSSA